jgi:HD-like signal output (HDOD) protein/DNA-binding CsgD family transcriptional regulator
MNSGVPSSKQSLTGDSLAVNGRGERRRQPDPRARLLLAFEAVDAFPALAVSRNRLLSVITDDHHATADAIFAIESDVALVIAVLRLANSGQPARGRIETVARAVELLPAHAIRALAERVRTFDFFARAGTWSSTPQRFRLHALATQRAADRIASTTRYADRERLAVTSLLHDVGKLALIHAHPGYPAHVHDGAVKPEERIQRERRELGVDHAMVGGVLIRRWGLPASLATPIECHHNPDAEGEAAIIRLADMLAHYDRGTPVSRGAMLQSARAVGLSPARLQRLMQEAPGSSRRRRQIEPSPLTRRELEVLRQLAKGSVYARIAHDLALTASTIRSHLHNIYGKIGVVDRAQAVLVAEKRGWL